MVGGLKETYVHTVRRFVAACLASRYQRAAVRRTQRVTFHLVQHAVIPVCDTTPAKPENSAVASARYRRQQRRAQRVSRHAKTFVQAIDIDDAQLWHNTLVRIDVRSQQSGNHVPWQCVRPLELP